MGINSPARGGSRGERMSGGFSKHGGGVQKKDFHSPRGKFSPRGGNRGGFSSRGGGRGGFSPRGGGRGGFSPRGGGRGGFSPRGGGRGGFSPRGGGNFGMRGRGSFGRGDGRGPGGSWGDRGRGGYGGNNQGRKRTFENEEDSMDDRKRMSFDSTSKTAKGEQNTASGKKNKNKFKKSVSEPSTPALQKVKKFEVENDEDDEELSLSDMEDEESSKVVSTTKTLPKKIAANVTAKEKGKKSPLAISGMKLTQLANGKNFQKKKTGLHGHEEGMDESEGVAANKKVKKTKMVSAESSDEEEEDEEESGEEDEDEEESEEDEEETVQRITKSKAVNGAFEKDESDEDEDEEEDEEDEESLEDEDEEEAPSEEKTSLFITPGKSLPLKSALKTPGTAKSVSKKVLLSSSPATPETSSKSKTPVTPHPKKLESKTPTKHPQRLKFEESDESDEDEEEEDEDEEEVDEKESKLVENEKRKIMGNAGSEDEDEDEEMTDEDEEGSDEDEEEEHDFIDAKAGIMKTKQKEVLQELDNKQSKGTEKKAVAQKKVATVAGKEEPPKGVKRKVEDELVLKPEDAKDVISEEQKRREERDKKSLFVRGLPKDVKLAQLKALHDDVVYVRHMPHRNFAWLFFANEQLCEKAYEDISKQTIEGKTLTVDFCGAKSKTRPQKEKIQLPINPLELFVGGLPPSTSKDQMKVIFRQATNINFPKQAKAKNKLFCFIQFGSEKEARAAFEKGKTLKVNGVPVDVLYARIRRGITDGAKSQNATTDSSVPPSTVSKLETKKLAKEPKVSDDDATDEEIESSDEGIEELNISSLSPPKKAKLEKEVNSEKMRQIASINQKKISEASKGATVLKKALQPKLNGTSGKALSAQSKIVSPGDNMDDEDEDEDDKEDAEDDEKEEEEEEDEDEEEEEDDDDDMEDSDEDD